MGWWVAGCLVLMMAALICVALLLCQLCHSPSLARVTLDGLCHRFHNAMGISQEELTRNPFSILK